MNIINKIIAPIVRISLTIIILVFVWLNAHWSVAISITLITIAIELLGISLKKILKIIKTTK